MTSQNIGYDNTNNTWAYLQNLGVFFYLIDRESFQTDIFTNFISISIHNATLFLGYYNSLTFSNCTRLAVFL